MHLYLLCGMAFAGKTTLARALARHFRAAVVSLDDINASRGLHGGLGTRERSPVTEPVLLDLAQKFEAPAADENLLVFPADMPPEAWVAERFPRSR